MLHRIAIATLPFALALTGCSDGTGMDSCFVPGTRVATPSGPRAIEELSVGDAVLSFDPAERVMHVGRVTVVHRALVREVRAIRAEGFEVRGVTREHPFYDAVRNRFVRAEELRVGDRVMVVERGESRVVAIESVTAHELAEPLITVINLTIGGAPPMFLAEGFVVHNKLPFDSGHDTGMDTATSTDAATEADAASEDADDAPSPDAPSADASDAGAETDANDGG